MFSELGAALCFFFFVVPELTLAELVGFSVAAGSMEAIVLPFMKNPLQGTPLEGHAEETSAMASGTWRFNGRVLWRELWRLSFTPRPRVSCTSVMPPAILSRHCLRSQVLHP